MLNLLPTCEPELRLTYDTAFTRYILQAPHVRPSPENVSVALQFANSPSTQLLEHCVRLLHDSFRTCCVKRALDGSVTEQIERCIFARVFPSQVHMNLSL
jgi:hypothetical protein